jgi:hypothetical protein
MTSARSDQGPRSFTALSESQCRELLRAHNVGRIAWQAADGPQILPITYAWHDEALVFRTSPYGVLSELVRATDVAVGVDELDEQHRAGWSVMVQGRAQAVAEPANIVQLWTVDNLVPWAPGTRNLFIKIVPRRITGRILQGRDRDVDSDHGSLQT